MSKKRLFRQGMDLSMQMINFLGGADFKCNAVEKPAPRKSFSIPDRIRKDQMLEKKKKEIQDNVKISDVYKEGSSSCTTERSSLSWIDCLPSETYYSDSEEFSLSDNDLGVLSIDEPRSKAANAEEDFEDFVGTVDACLDLDIEDQACRKLKHPNSRPLMSPSLSDITNVTMKDHRNMMAKFQPASTSTPNLPPGDKILPAHGENQVCRKLKHLHSRTLMSPDLSDIANSTIKDSRQRMAKFHPVSTSTPNLWSKGSIHNLQKHRNSKETLMNHVSKAHSFAREKNQVCRKLKHPYSRPSVSSYFSSINNTTVKGHRTMTAKFQPVLTSTPNLWTKEEKSARRGSYHSLQKRRNSGDTPINHESNAYSSDTEVSGISLHVEPETCESRTFSEICKSAELTTPRRDDISQVPEELNTKLPDSSLVKNKDLQIKQSSENCAVQVLEDIVPKSRYEKESFYILDTVENILNNDSTHLPSMGSMLSEEPVTHTTVKKSPHRKRIQKPKKNKKKQNVPPQQPAEIVEKEKSPEIDNVHEEGISVENVLAEPFRKKHCEKISERNSCDEHSDRAFALPMHGENEPVLTSAKAKKVSRAELNENLSPDNSVVPECPISMLFKLVTAKGGGKVSSKQKPFEIKRKEIETDVPICPLEILHLNNWDFEKIEMVSSKQPKSEELIE